METQNKDGNESKITLCQGQGKREEKEMNGQKIQRSFVDLLTDCRIERVNKDFTERRFPLEKVAQDEEDWEVTEHFFGEKVSLDEGLRRLSKLADKGEIRLPDGSRRAMEYIAARSRAQLMKRRIFLPLLAQRSVGRWCLPVFVWYGNCGGILGLSLYYLDRKSIPDRSWSWLVFRRKQKTL